MSNLTENDASACVKPLTRSLVKDVVSGGATLQKFIGVAGCGDAPVTTGGANDFVNHAVNGLYELQTDAHSISGYDEGYYWRGVDIGSRGIRILKKTSDGTWNIVRASTVKYSNSATGSVPPATGWSTESAGTAPAPTLLFNTLITEQTPVALTNCSVVSRNQEAGEITLKSTVASGTKTIEFGDATGISDGDLYVVGYQIKDDGNVTVAANVRFGQYGAFVRSSSTFGGSTSYRGEGWQQEFGKDRFGADVTIDTNVGLQFQHYGSTWAENGELTFKNLRVMIA